MTQTKAKLEQNVIDPLTGLGYEPATIPTFSVKPENDGRIKAIALPTTPSDRLTNNFLKHLEITVTDNPFNRTHPLRIGSITAKCSGGKLILTQHQRLSSVRYHAVLAIRLLAQVLF